MVQRKAIGVAHLWTHSLSQQSSVCQGLVDANSQPGGESQGLLAASSQSSLASHGLFGSTGQHSSTL